MDIGREIVKLQYEFGLACQDRGQSNFLSVETWLNFYDISCWEAKSMADRPCMPREVIVMGSLQGQRLKSTDAKVVKAKWNTHAKSMKWYLEDPSIEYINPRWMLGSFLRSPCKVFSSAWLSIWMKKLLIARMSILRFCCVSGTLKGEQQMDKCLISLRNGILVFFALCLFWGGGHDNYISPSTVLYRVKRFSIRLISFIGMVSCFCTMDDTDLEYF